MPYVIAYIAEGIYALLTAGRIYGALARVAFTVILSTVASKLFGPKVPAGELTGAQVMTRSALEYRKVVYGRAMVSGPIVFNNLSGTNGEYLWYVVPIADGEIEGFVSIWFDGDEIPIADIDWTPGVSGADGSGTGDVSTAKWVGENSTAAAQLFYFLGHPNQVATAKLTAAFAQWTSSHRARNVPYFVAKLLYDEDTANVWQQGAPSNIKALVDGRKVYDPRKYAITDDPDFTTIGKPIGGGCRWFGGASETAVFGATADSFSVAGGVLTVTDNNDTTEQLFSESLPVDLLKDYTVIVDGRQTAGDRRNYLGVAFYDSNGDVISNSSSPVSDATGWGAIGTYHYFGVINTAFAGTWTEYSIDFGPTGTATIPSNAVTMQIAGLLCRDGPVGTDTTVELRDFAIFEGTTRQSISDSSTWEHSDNPALCAADYLTQVMGVDAALSIEWPSVITAADACDVTVEIDAASPPATEKRFTCNGAISLGDTHRDNLDAIASSMDGKIIYSGGRWFVRASIWQASSVTITASDICDNAEVQGSSPKSLRINKVRGYFVDPARKYEATEFPHVSDAAYLARDGGLEIAYDLQLPCTNSATMAQRIGFRTLEQANNQKLVKLSLNAVGIKTQVGDTVTLDLPAMGWTAGENQLVRSQEFDTGWTQANCSVSANAIAGPLGGVVADELIEDGTAATQHRLDQTSSVAAGVATLSVFAKANTRSKIVLRIGSNGLRSIFDLAAGTVDNLIDATARYGMDYYGNGWWRCWITEDAAGNDIARINLIVTDQVDYDGDGSSGLYLFGAQISNGYGPPGHYIETQSVIETTAAKDFRCVEWSRQIDGKYELTLKEDFAASYTDPAGGDYDASNTTGVTLPTDVVPPPSGLTATGMQAGIELAWTNPAPNLFDYIEIYEDTDDSWSGATLIATVRASRYFVPHSNGTTYYYWIRAVREPAFRSIRDPDNDTTTISAADTSPPSAAVLPIGGSFVDVVNDPADAEVGYRIDSDGDVYRRLGTGGSWVSIGTWMLSGVNSDYEIKVSKDSGDDTTSGESLDTWLVPSTDRDFIMTETVLAGPGNIGNFTVSWRNASTLQVYGTAGLYLEADVETGS